MRNRLFQIAAAFVLVAAGRSSPTAGATVWTDPPGDVTLPNADIITASASVDAGAVDLRWQTQGTPFAGVHNLITICLDLDRNKGTGNKCGASF